MPRKSNPLVKQDVERIRMRFLEALQAGLNTSNASAYANDPEADLIDYLDRITFPTVTKKNHGPQIEPTWKDDGTQAKTYDDPPDVVDKPVAAAHKIEQSITVPDELDIDKTPWPLLRAQLLDLGFPKSAISNRKAAKDAVSKHRQG